MKIMTTLHSSFKGMPFSEITCLDFLSVCLLVFYVFKESYNFGFTVFFCYDESDSLYAFLYLDQQ